MKTIFVLLVACLTAHAGDPAPRFVLVPFTRANSSTLIRLDTTTGRSWYYSVSSTTNGATATWIEITEGTEAQRATLKELRGYSPFAGTNSPNPSATRSPGDPPLMTSADYANIRAKTAADIQRLEAELNPTSPPKP